MLLRLSFFSTLSIALLSAACTQPPVTPPSSSGFDIVITGGRIVDGTGSPWFAGDIGITGDYISAIGRLADQPATRRIDATGLVVAPGFVDMLGQSEFNVLVDGRAASKIRRLGHHHGLVQGKKLGTRRM